MIRPLLLAPLAALAFAAEAQAFDISDMSDAEQEAFRGEIREYLLENPEVLMEAIAVLEQRQAEQQVENDRARVAASGDALYDDGYSWIGGNPEGDVTLVEFMDYRCSFCRRAHPEVQELVNGDGNIRYIVKEYPILGDESVAASRFAIAVKNVEGEDAYKKVHDELITIRGTMNEDTFSRISDSLGFDTDAILVEMQNPEIDAQIQSNYRLAQSLEISGTPTFVFDTELVRGYVPLESMQGIVEAIREGS